jgi:mono/diheme cytochrome c family protein
VDLDTTLLSDGPHRLRVRATGAQGRVGTRTIPFEVQNGPGITVNGLRAGERVSGKLTLVVAWAGWYGVAEFVTPAPFASTPTYEAHPSLVNAPLQADAPPKYSGRGSAAGFDYAQTGAELYASNCAACHGAAGAGVPGAFPPLAGDPVVTASSPESHLTIVLHGLHGKSINGTSYASQMAAFPQLSDDDIAAIVDHERTSWGNEAPIVTPDDVTRAR